MSNAVEVHCPNCGTKTCDVELNKTHIVLKCPNAKCKKLVDVKVSKDGEVITRIISNPRIKS